MITGKNVGLRAVEKEDLSLFRDWRNLTDFRRNFREVRELSLTDQEAWFESLQKTKHINLCLLLWMLKPTKPLVQQDYYILIGSIVPPIFRFT